MIPNLVQNSARNHVQTHENNASLDSKQSSTANARRLSLFQKREELSQVMTNELLKSPCSSTPVDQMTEVKQTEQTTKVAGTYGRSLD